MGSLCQGPNKKSFEPTSPENDSVITNGNIISTPPSSLETKVTKSQYSSSDSKVTKITKEVSNGNESRVELDVEALEKVLNNREWSGYDVAVYSIAGPFRSGKSFLLSVLYHYFKEYFQVAPGDDSESVLHQTKEVEKVFAWKGGARRHTDGIYILSQPILFPPENPQVAIFLMDTQGLFDIQAPTQDLTFIGSLSFLISSLQIFNLNGRIENIHLEQVYRFSEIARRVKDKVPTQENKEELMFVVRDWENDEECPLGIEGGAKYLDTLLRTKKSKNEATEHILMKNFLKGFFQTPSCMLLPHPGSQIKKENLALKDLDPDFGKGVNELVEHISVESKEPFKAKYYPKNIQGHSLTCKRLYHYITGYAKVLKECIALDINNEIQSDMEFEMVNLVLEGFDKLKKEINTNIQVSSDDSKNKFLSQLVVDFENKIPSHSLKCFHDEWKKEFSNLLWQIVYAVEICTFVEETIFQFLNDVNEWRKKEFPSNQLLTEKERRIVGEHREKQIEKLNNDIKKRSENMHEKIEENGSEQEQISVGQKEVKVDLINFIAPQYEEYFVTRFNKILVERPNEIPLVSSEVCLDLVLGDIDIRPYQDIKPPISSSASGGSNDLALSRFSEGALTVKYLLGKVTIPLYCSVL